MAIKILCRTGMQTANIEGAKEDIHCDPHARGTAFAAQGNLDTAKTT